MSDILVIHSGGTIGMVPSAAGLVPDPNFVARLQAALPEADFDVFVCEPAIDSSSATPAAWQRLADAVAAHREQYRAFVVLHGTDTLAYSAAALSGMLCGLGKAVVVTGSQIPLGMPESDALRNIRGALAFAALPDLQQVAVFFYDRLLRGEATRKVDAQSYAGFDSPNTDWLGVFDGNTAQLSAPVFEEREESAYLRGAWRGFQEEAVATLLITPGMPSSAFAPLLADDKLRALVLLSYGVGNLPERDDLHTALRAAIARGVCVVNVSQCLRGEVAGHSYAVGAARLGALGGGRLTPEAVYTRLHCLLAESDTRTLAERWSSQ